MPKVNQILAFESSCDDTSVALVRALEGEPLPEVVSFSVQSQWEIHEKFGGVVPDLAARAHLKNLIPCLEKVLAESKTSLEEIDAFAATASPGLVGCLLIGHTAAKTLSFLFKKPFISCNHIEGHLMSSFLSGTPEFPFLCLVVSGGHTSLFIVRDFDQFENIGLTLDDAAGEAFDKGAKLLGFEFPGGPEIDRYAQSGNPLRYRFGKVQTKDFLFSFSGLKSEFGRLVKAEGEHLDKKDAAASYQNALLNHLLDKVKKALEAHQLKDLAIVGGVAANTELRARLEEWKKEGVIRKWFGPPLRFCTDNAAMIGVRAYRSFLNNEFSELSDDVRSTIRPARKKSHG